MYQKLKKGVLVGSTQFHNIRSLNILLSKTPSEKWHVFYLIFPIRLNAIEFVSYPKATWARAHRRVTEACQNQSNWQCIPLRGSVNTHYHLSHGIQACKYLISSGGLIGPHSAHNALSGNVSSISKTIKQLNYSVDNKLLKWLTAWDLHLVTGCV